MLVLGSGVAGLSCAIAAASAGAQVMLVTPGEFDFEAGSASELAGGNTALAQGGIAAAVGEGDDPRLHAEDTAAAGAGLVDAVAAAQLTARGAEAVRALIDDGFAVDRRPDGSLSLGLEAAHGRARIVHAGEDRTGASLHAFLRARLRPLVQGGRIGLTERSTAVSLLSDAGAVTGAVLRDADGQLSAVRADAVVLATGGYAALYAETSNHVGAKGEGIVLAARLGAVVADLEFVQFHPTVLAGTGFLISEAVRGAGAVLRDGSGDRFMLRAHEAAELAPRDVVSRTVHRVLRERGESHVWLDATGIEREHGAGTLAERFPSITAATHRRGYDWAREPVPVAPAAHYTMGGIVTDLDARTSLPGLFAAGEVSSTGVHGANRLASNSLLEGLVFGARAAHAGLAYMRPRAQGGGEWAPNGEVASGLMARAQRIPGGDAMPGSAVAAGAARGAAGPGDAASETTVRAALDRGLGIERDAAGLSEVCAVAEAHEGMVAELAAMIARSAEARTESRGAHQRADFPQADDAQRRRNSWFLRSSSMPPEQRRDIARDEPRRMPAC